MSETGDRPTTRRAFAAGAGVLAAAIGGAARAQPDANPAPAAAPGGPPGAATGSGAPVSPTDANPTPALPAATPNSPARARDLGKLSNILYNNPAERALFLSDPPSYAVRLGLRSISAADLGLLRNVFADGFCCMGCGC
jgi:hypothetical protein